MNRTLLLILPLLLLSFSGFAQLQKGNKVLGGTLNYATSNATPTDLIGLPAQTNKSNSFNISPLIGVFVTDRTVVGFKLDSYSYSSESTITGQEFRNEFNRFGFGPFVRRYFPVKEWVAFYGQADLGYSFGKTKQTYSSFPNQNSERSMRTLNLSASLGIAFFPTNWMSIDLSLNPLSFSNTVDKNVVGSSSPDQNINSFNFNINSQSFFVGANFFLNKK